MKRLINLSAVLALSLVFTTATFAQDDIVVPQNPIGPNWVDLDGDGVCDNFGTDLQGQGAGTGNGYGLKDGSGAGTKPQDGTGFGKMNGAGKGVGVGDGTGTGAADGSGQASRKRGGRN